MKKIKIVVCEPGKSPEICEINDDLESMQNIVGGYIECIALKNNIDVWVNEEGLLMDLPFNRTVNRKPLVGTIFAASHNKSGDTTSLSAQQIKDVLVMFGAS